jgi:hypothetical protein
MAGNALARRIEELEAGVAPGTPEAEALKALVTHATGGLGATLAATGPERSVEDVLAAYDRATQGYRRSRAPVNGRPRVSPEEQDRLYGISLAGSASAASLLRSVGRPERGRAYLDRIDATPANGHQYLLRGQVRKELLRDEKGAQRDFRSALSLLYREQYLNPGSEYARRALEDLRRAMGNDAPGR